MLGGGHLGGSIGHDLMSLSPALGSVLTAQSLEPASDSVSLPLCPSPARALSLSLSKINIKFFLKLIFF